MKTEVLGIIESHTELTTAITDLILALECLFILIWWRRQSTTDTMRRSIWSWVLGLLGGASLAAAIAHGLKMSRTVNELLWKPIYLTLGVLVAFFLIGAIHDWLGHRISRRCIP